MFEHTRMRPMLVMFAFCAFMAAGSAKANAQDYKPGQKVEYKAQAYPEKWEVGTVEHMAPGGKQVIIREKPTEFFPQGNTRAYSLDEVRLPGQGRNQAQGTAPDPQAQAARNDRPDYRTTAVGEGSGLMTKQEILVFLQDRLGDKPFQVAYSKREAVFKELGQTIMGRGVNFRYETLSQFSNDLGKFGAPSTVTFPIQANYGASTKQAWYIGTWNTSVTSAGRRVIIGAKAGFLTIDANGSYVWKLYPTDPPASYVKGSWRKATPEEMAVSYQGGDGLVLLKGKEGYDWLVRQDRETTLSGDWIWIANLNARAQRVEGKRR
ncbi:MAG TPA: hypothetical protein VI837_08520 [Blastocatellia bacterium]|nr:hypothetical protein [Blastocatellia bacterium]